MCDDRLKEKLSAAGIPASVTDTFARPALLDLYSQLVATGRNKLSPATAETLSDIELKKRRLDLEERKLSQQAELEREQRAEQAEQRKLERLRLIEQTEHRKVQAQLESKRLDLEIERVGQQTASAKSPTA